MKTEGKEWRKERERGGDGGKLITSPQMVQMCGTIVNGSIIIS